MVRAAVCRRLPNDFSYPPSALVSVALLAAAWLFWRGIGRRHPPRERPDRSTLRRTSRGLRSQACTSSRGKRALKSVRGRIVYDFSGSACEGYALQFRQVTELDSGEGKVALSDLRTTTWEEGEGKSFRFKSQNYMDQQQLDEVDGSAERDSERGRGQAEQARGQEVRCRDGRVSDRAHAALIEAARAGKSLLEVQVYDGSETGEKIYHTLSVIGHRIEPEQEAGRRRGGQGGARRSDALAGDDQLFRQDREEGRRQPSEQTPVYAISFEIYENGISRALMLDYGDFVIDGKMSSLEVKKAKACK